MNTSEVAKLITYLEENLRASPAAGLPFVDPRHLRSRLLSKQNHVVFGRRGAGKTSLVKSASGRLYIYLDIEGFKDITFPNIVIHVLVDLFSHLQTEIRRLPLRRRFIARGISKRLHRTILLLSSYLHEPDVEVQEVRTREACGREAGAQARTPYAAVGARVERKSSKEVARTLPRKKMDFLLLELNEYKRLLADVSRFFSNAPIFLVMDDFYFVQKGSQPDLIDYFHRLTKGTSLFLKVATIKHRSKLYRRTTDRYVGVELGADVIEIDMDYTLDKFDDLQVFMQQLLRHAVEQSGAMLDVEELFAGEGLSQLCLASGGVPRDFLYLFISLANTAAASGTPIGKVQVNEVAISNLSNKLESMRRDSGDEVSVLEACLRSIKRHVYEEKRTNAFLIAKEELESDDQGRQAVRELVDLRFIHLLDHNTSRAPSDGKRYEAYILDVSLYDNARPRLFSQIQPGQHDEKARKDDLRASPVFLLSKLKSGATPAEARHDHRRRAAVPESGQLDMGLILSEE